MKKTLVLSLLLLLTCSAAVFAEGAGIVEGEFLKFGTGARSAGMGEAFTAVSNNAHAVHWNPAGLVQLKNKEMQVMYLHHLIDIWIGNIAYAQKVGEKGGVGVELLQLYVKEIMRDEEGNEIGEFTDYNGGLTVGYGYSVNESLSLGLSVKNIYLRYMEQVKTGKAVDIGILYRVGAAGMPIQLGVVIKDVGEDMPTRTITGVSSELIDNMTVSADIITEQSGSTETNMGIEYETKGKLVLRGGYTKLGSWEGIEGIHGICGGLGLKFNDKTFNYAFTPYGELGIAHRISFQIKF
jgi:long-subunit fatty acid transport protein